MSGVTVPVEIKVAVTNLPPSLDDWLSVDDIFFLNLVVVLLYFVILVFNQMTQSWGLTLLQSLRGEFNSCRWVKITVSYAQLTWCYFWSPHLQPLALELFLYHVITHSLFLLHKRAYAYASLQTLKKKNKNIRPYNGFIFRFKHAQAHPVEFIPVRAQLSCFKTKLSKRCMHFPPAPTPSSSYSCFPARNSFSRASL